MDIEVAIIGGGPAGLSAALVLGRCRRKTLVFDDGRYRNAYSTSMHGFLTRDGIDPKELRKIAREQLQNYPTVSINETCVQEVARLKKGFSLLLQTGEKIECRKLLLTTGLVDFWPKIKGAEPLYGKGVFHCPICDGYEVCDQPLALLGKGDKAGSAAIELKIWSSDVIFCTDGPGELSQKCLDKLARHHIPLYEDKIVTLTSKDNKLEAIVFEEGKIVPRAAIFFNAPCLQRSDLAKQLSCEFDEDGGVKTNKYEATSVPGLFVAGDTSRDVFQAIVGAGEGSAAAVAINMSLAAEDFT